jgi:hypothetical protein
MTTGFIPIEDLMKEAPKEIGFECTNNECDGVKLSKTMSCMERNNRIRCPVDMSIKLGRLSKEAGCLCKHIYECNKCHAIYHFYPTTNKEDGVDHHVGMVPIFRSDLLQSRQNKKLENKLNEFFVHGRDDHIFFQKQEEKENEIGTASKKRKVEETSSSIGGGGEQMVLNLLSTGSPANQYYKYDRIKDQLHPNWQTPMFCKHEITTVKSITVTFGDKLEVDAILPFCNGCGWGLLGKEYFLAFPHQVNFNEIKRFPKYQQVLSKPFKAVVDLAIEMHTGVIKKALETN